MMHNVSGVVTAQAKVHKGVVQEVTILTGPAVFHQAVIDALKQYKCATLDEDFMIKQAFEFKIQTLVPAAKSMQDSK